MHKKIGDYVFTYTRMASMKIIAAWCTYNATLQPIHDRYRMVRLLIMYKLKRLCAKFASIVSLSLNMQLRPRGRKLA